MTAEGAASLHWLRGRFEDVVVTATVSARAASLRQLTVDGMDLVESTAGFADAPGMAGAILVPWPNRVENATWDLDGKPQHLEVTEEEFGHANHGLLAFTDYQVVTKTEERIELTATISDRAGYPFVLDVDTVYSLTPHGIRVLHQVTNQSTRPAPFALGAHPYLRHGEADVRDLTLRISASTASEMDDRHIPRGAFSVEGTAWDLRQGRRVSEAVAHASYSDLEVEGDEVVHRLGGPYGRWTELWAQPQFRWTQIYVTNELPSDSGGRTAVAVEPMTAPPNALRTGQDIFWIEPGSRWMGEWGIRLS